MDTQFQKGDVVVRRRGEAREAKVLWIGERQGILFMTIQYQDTFRVAYYCRPHNYVLAEGYKAKPYKPKPETLARLKRHIEEEWGIIQVGTQRYLIVFYGGYDGRMMDRLVKEGFFGPKTRLGRVVHNAGLTWREFRDDVAKEKGRPVQYNVSVYKIKKDISDFSW